MKALMIDLETLSLRPTAKVLQVGYALVRDDGPVETHDIWVDDPTGHIDQGTVAWWETQDPEVRRRVFHAPDGVQRMNSDQVYVALSEVYQRLGGKEGGVTVWAKPGMFDLPILTHMWGGRKPWPYYMERDLYTLARTIDKDKALYPPPNGLAHVASADALWQMQYLIALRTKAMELGVDVT